MVFGEIESALSLWGRLREWHRRRKGSASATESVATRLVRVLGSHGVHRNQIPRFVGYGISVKDVESDATLMTALTEEVLEGVCARLAIRREWLDGADSQVHPYYDFYKRPSEFLAFVEELKEKNPDGEIAGVVIAPVESELGADALLILQETIGHVGEKPIFRYHLCNNWGFDYWKGRGYLTACIAICWKRNIYVHGIHKTKAEIKQLAWGETLLGWQGEGIWELGHTTWHPEDMTISPEEFLRGIRAEQNNFGIKSALRLWLRLDEQGFLDSGLGGSSREAFEQELAKWEPGTSEED